jgi:hypothetical protein
MIILNSNYLNIIIIIKILQSYFNNDKEAFKNLSAILLF